jgi:PAS domain S-box-containing protein
MSSAQKSPELTPSALVTSRRTMAADLEDTRLLQELGARLVDEDNIDAIYQEILAAAITLTRADAGVVQILDPSTGDLSVLSAKGFSEDLVIRFRRVDVNSPTSCGMALRSNQRAFVDFDTPGDPNPTFGLLLEAGYRSAQSTPLVSRAGTLIGMITTHWSKHHRPTDRELRFLDLLARQAADLIHHRQLEQSRREQDAQMASERADVQKAFAADLFDTRMLSDLATRVVPESEIQAVYDDVNATARRLMDAEGGTLQILDPETNDLVLHSAHGFPGDSILRYQRVDAGSRTSCGSALSSGARTFVDFDDATVEDPDGDLGWHRRAGYLCAQSTPLITRSGRPVGMLSTHWKRRHQPDERELRFLDMLARQAADLIERMASEEALRDSERRYRALFDSIDEGFCTIEVIFNYVGRPWDYRFLQVNPSFVRLTGIPDAVGRTMRELSPELEPYWFENYGRIARTGEPERFVAEAKGFQRWYDVYAFRVDDPGLNHVAILFNDVTQRIQTEEQLRHAHDALESRVKERTGELAAALKRVQNEVDERKKIEGERRDLLQRVVHLQEAERARVARELHDNLGQHMVAVLMHLEGFQRKLSQSGNAEASNDLEEFRKVVDGLIKATHRQSWELRPAELDELGLDVALENYVQQWSEKTGIAADFQATDVETRVVEPEQMIAFYRVTQEALTNVARHAHASRVSVSLEVEDSICLSIRDNGVGFDPATVKRRLGLLGMQERLQILGGTLDIDSASGRGTCIRACIP